MRGQLLGTEERIVPRDEAGDDGESGHADAVRADLGHDELHDDPAQEDMEDEEAPKIVVKRRPYMPTQKEIDEHMPTHIPYRSWCPHCVAGKGISGKHVGGEDQDKIGVTISLDYCFMGTENDPDELMPVLVMHDDSLELIWALPVESKGPTKYVVDWCTRKLDEAGYRGQRISLKSDEEPAIMALKRAIAAERSGPSALIASPVRESKSNGAVEKAIQSWQGQFRVIKHHLEHKFGLHAKGEKLPISHPILGWMVVWAAELLMKFKKRSSDGRTAYESMTGHRCKHPVMEVGETLMFRTAVNKTSRHKADEYWHEGMLLGMDSATTGFILLSGGALYKCAHQNTRKVTSDRAYSPDNLNKLSVTFKHFIDTGASTSSPGVRPSGEIREGAGGRLQGGPDGRRYAPRDFKITQERCEKYGYTIRCDGCTWMENKLGPRRAHTEECRNRFKKLMQEDDEDKG